MHQNLHPKEMQMVRFSMIILFSGLMIVYLLLYQIKGQDIAKELSAGLTGTLQSDSLATTGDLDFADLYKETGDDTESYTGTSTGLTQTNSLFASLGSGKTGSGTSSLFTGKQGSGKLSGMFSTGKLLTGTKTFKVLSGTSLYYGSVESAEKLGISYEYALKDQKNIYYVFLGTGVLRYDFDEITRNLGGSLFKVTTEQEMTKNKLFGDKVIYINLPEYKDKKVIILVYINDAVRLLQVDYTTYHKSKSYIKKLFIE